MNWEKWEILREVVRDIPPEKWHYSRWVVTLRDRAGSICGTKCCAFGAYVLRDMPAGYRDPYDYFSQRVSEMSGVVPLGIATIAAREFDISYDEARDLFCNVVALESVLSPAAFLAAMDWIESLHRKKEKENRCPQLAIPRAQE